MGSISRYTQKNLCLEFLRTVNQYQLTYSKLKQYIPAQWGHVRAHDSLGLHDEVLGEGAQVPNVSTLADQEHAEVTKTVLNRGTWGVMICYSCYVRG